MLSKEQFKKLIALSDQYNFVIASDECYSELWFDQAPTGLLEVCAELGRDDYKTVSFFIHFQNAQTYRVCVQVL